MEEKREQINKKNKSQPMLWAITSVVERDVLV